MKKRVDLIALSSLREVGVWNKGKLRILRSGSDVKAFALQPGGERLAISLDGERRIDIWSVKKKAVIFSFKRYQGDGGLSFSADGKVLAAVEAGRRIRLFDMEKRKKIASLKVPTGSETPVASATASNLFAYASSFPNAGNSLVYGLNTDGRGKALAKLKGSVRQIAISPDGSLVALNLWQGTAKGSGLVLCEVVRKQFRKVLVDRFPIDHLALSGNINKLGLAVVTRDGRLKWWDYKAATWRTLVLPGPSGLPLCVDFTAAGLGLLSGGVDKGGASVLQCSVKTSGKSKIKEKYKFKWDFKGGHVAATFCC